MTSAWSMKLGLTLILLFALWACSACSPPPAERRDAAAADLGLLDKAVFDQRAPDRGPPLDLPSPDTLPWCSLSGSVVDLSGKPLAGAAVAVCGSACWPATADSKGAFSLADGKLLQTAAGQGLDRVTWLIVGRAE